MDDLEKRVEQFITLSLPGQPMSMHMGTSYLVNDLWREVQRLRVLENLGKKSEKENQCERHSRNVYLGYKFCPDCGNPL